MVVKTPDEIFRDWVVDGVPSSGPWSPVKADIREYLNDLDDRVDSYDTPIFILASGQSNMARLSSSATWTVPGNLLVWNNYDLGAVPPAFTINTPGSLFVSPPNNRSNPAVAFAAQVARENPTRQVYLVVVALGGTAISHWLTPTSAPDMYAYILASMTPALAAAGVSKISNFLWWQGEQDAAAPTSYKDNFNTLVTQRLQVETWFPVTTPVIVFGIVGSAVNSNPVYEDFQQYLQQCVNHDADLRMFVNTRRLPVAMWDDTLHASGDGYAFLGEMAYLNYTKRMGQIPLFEQGKFTPTLTFGGGNTGMTGTFSGSYTRIGRRYFVDISITLTAKGSSTGAAEINGLPGNSIVAPNRSINVGRYISFSGLAGVPQGFAIANKVQLFESNVATSQALTDTKFTNTTTIQLSVNYDTN